MWTVSGTLWCFLQRRHLLIKSLFVLMKIVKLLKQNKKQLQGNVYPTVCTVKTMYINETKLPLLSVL